MGKVLATWIGNTDIRAAEGDEASRPGPIASAVAASPFDEILLLSDHTNDRTKRFVAWLKTGCTTPIHVNAVRLSGPTRFGEIHAACVDAVEAARTRHGPDTGFTFHLSPGTPAMAAVWILLAKTRYPAELIESSRDHGVQTVSVPFDISAEYLPDLLREPDRRLEQLSAGLPPTAPEFADIIHRSPAMKRLVARARLVAPRTVPVLIEGESGTGKELLARAIHRTSPRSDKPFIAINCGAIPPELVESELFGHEKGAFTGADRQRIGQFEAAAGGTLFLDEVGELPQKAQVKLLRVLQEGEILRVGSTRPTRIDVRIIAATNRNLVDEVGAGRFREDLFYRIAVAVLKVPPLRERSGDIGALVDHSVGKLNQEDATGSSGSKKLSVGARNLLLAHPWPGNVRELHNTLLRAWIWTPARVIDEEDIAESLSVLPRASGTTDAVLNRPLGEGLRLPDLLSAVARHYLERALRAAHGNKTKAAQLVGLASYQTLTNWLKRYDVTVGMTPANDADAEDVE